MMIDPVPAFTPVNLLTGFLGSGKTTLLRRLLLEPSLSDAAVLVNEFGEIGLDHHLLERIDETMVLLPSGCLCCTVRGELAQAIRDLHSKRERGLVLPFKRLLVESTGLADPFPVLSTIKADSMLRHHFRADNVITTVDAVNGLDQLDRYEETIRQAAIADRLVLTKTDIADDVATKRLVARLRQINPDAPIIDAAHEVIDVDALLASGSTASKSVFHCDDAVTAPPRQRTHGSTIRSFVLLVGDRIDWTAFGVWLTMLLNQHGGNVLRVKGILNIDGEAAPVAIHGVQYLVHAPVHMRAWPDTDRRSRIVFILDGLDPETVRRSFLAFNRLADPRSAAAKAAGPSTVAGKPVSQLGFHS